MAIGVGLIASVMATWPANERFTYGYGRIETLSGFANGIFLILISIFIIFEAIQRMYVTLFALVNPFMMSTAYSSLDPPEMNTSQLLLISSLGLGVNLFGMFAMGGHHHHVCTSCPLVGSADSCCRDIPTRTAVTLMDTDMVTLMRHLHPSSLKRRMDLSAMIMTIMGTDTHTITAIHILTIHTLIPQLRNRTLTHIQTHALTLIRTRGIPIRTLIYAHFRTPLLLRPKYLRGDILMYQLLTVTHILRLLPALILILLSTPMRMGITHIHTLIHTRTRQRRTG